MFGNQALDFMRLETVLEAGFGDSGKRFFFLRHERRFFQGEKGFHDLVLLFHSRDYSRNFGGQQVGVEFVEHEVMVYAGCQRLGHAGKIVERFEQCACRRCGIIARARLVAKFSRALQVVFVVQHDFENRARLFLLELLQG